MLTLSYLQTILIGEVERLNDLEHQVIESAGGYDGIVALIQTKGLQKAVVLEHNSVGEMSALRGGFMMATQSIWIMQMVARDADRPSVQKECFTDMKRILCVLTKYAHSEQLKGWQSESIPYAIRNAGPNYTGYEFSLNFSEDVDLSYKALPKAEMEQPVTEQTVEEEGNGTGKAG